MKRKALKVHELIESMDNSILELKERIAKYQSEMVKTGKAHHVQGIITASQQIALCQDVIRACDGLDLNSYILGKPPKDE